VKAIHALAKAGTPEAVERLRDLARSDDAVLREEATKRLERIAEERR
jgi:HEAT repeat protein